MKLKQLALESMFIAAIFALAILILYIIGAIRKDPEINQANQTYSDPRSFLVTGKLAAMHARSYQETHNEIGGLIQTLNLPGSLGAVKIIPEDKLRNISNG